MNIKSLLIGSAAAIVAVSGARAADAVVIAEPEPFEYVRVCDTYGAGFFYIPGTETCLEIGGYVRYQIDWNDGDDDRLAFTGDLDDLLFPPEDTDDIINDEGGWRKLARANIHLDARSETEWGTFRRYIEIQANAYSGGRLPRAVYQLNIPDDGSSPDPLTLSLESAINNYLDHRNVLVNYAFIELGGLYLGFGDSLWDQGLSGEQDTNFAYDDSVHRLSYTFSGGNGFSVTAALEELDYNYDYTPNVVGQVAFTQGWGAISLWGAYDATAEEAAFKAIATFNATDAIDLELMGIYATDPNDYWAASEWSVAAFARFHATEKLALGLGGQYYGAFSGGADRWVIGGQIDYTVVENLAIKTWVNWADVEDGDDSVSAAFRVNATF